MNAGGVTQSALSAIGAWPEQENVSELYFTDPTAIPSTYTPGTAMTVNFTLRNRESAPARYTYVIEQTDPEAKKTVRLLTGDLQLDTSERRTNSPAVIPQDMGTPTRLRVIVSAPTNDPNKDRNLEISYWLNNTKEVN